MLENKHSKDFFSNNSEIYSQGRPSHPTELFEYLASLVFSKDLAWDVACGNGQAALCLANYFKKVIATDMSSQQIKYAAQNPKIEYFVETAENSDSSLLKPNSVDLITVAVAIHWFPLQEFYSRVSKVLKPDGIIACWGYGYPQVNPKVDKVMLQLENDYFKPLDPPEFRHILNQYTDIFWPFRTPKNCHPTVDGVDRSFTIIKSVDLEQYCSYLRTRSSAQLYIEKEGKDAVDILYPDLLSAWGGDPKVSLQVKWALFLRVGCL